MIAATADALLVVALIVLLAVRVRTLLAYFQQEEYDSTRFPSAIWRMRLFDVMASATLLVVIGGGMWLGLEDMTQIVAAAALIVIALRERRYRFKKAPVVTERFKRIYVPTLAALGILAFAVLLQPLLAIIVIQAAPLVIMAVALVLQPYEDRNNEQYITQARQKLAGFNGVRIGITGSFGKTSVKYMLGQALGIDQAPFYSRGSINTLLGLTRHIRQRLQPAHTHFIAEMGAYQIGSIQRLAEFVRPDFGIVTAVGDAHRERFGGIAEVANAKSELAAWICAHGRLLVTTEAVLEHKPFRDLFDAHRDKFLVCGPSENADVQILEGRLVGSMRTLKLRFKNDGETIEFSSPYLARHSDDNLALVVALVSWLSPQTLPYLPALFPHLEQTPHRLEKKDRVSLPLLLDDAYNANEVGFAEAVELLRTLADERGGKAILITPGIVELGDAHEPVHRRLGMLCGRLCHQVYVVNPDRIPSFVEGLRTVAGTAEITLVTRFSDARKDAEARYRDRRDVILYENDLPDLLEERRLL